MNDNLFSIGDVSRILGITRKIILNYETCGLVAPDVKNGINGNRYYTIDTITKIRIIRLFQSYGLALPEIREYFTGSTDLISLVHRLEAIRDRLNDNINSLYERIATSDIKISQITVPAQTVCARRKVSDNLQEKTDFLRDTAIIAITKYKTDFSKPQYFIEFNYKNPSDILFCATVDSNSCGDDIVTMTSKNALAACHYGSYQNIDHTRTHLLQYADINKIPHTGDFREVYLEGPPQHSDPNKYITNIYLFLFFILYSNKKRNIYIYKKHTNTIKLFLNFRLRHNQIILSYSIMLLIRQHYLKKNCINRIFLTEFGIFQLYRSV